MDRQCLQRFDVSQPRYNINALRRASRGEEPLLFSKGGQHLNRLLVGSSERFREHESFNVYHEGAEFPHVIMLDSPTKKSKSHFMKGVHSGASDVNNFCFWGGGCISDWGLLDDVWNQKSDCDVGWMII
jgi:hypothetical protein